jgi:hypothetical protein
MPNNIGYLQTAAHFLTELTEAQAETRRAVDLVPDRRWFEEQGLTVSEIEDAESAEGIQLAGYEFTTGNRAFSLYVPPAEWQMEVPFVVVDNGMGEEAISLALGTYIGNTIARHLESVAA